MVPAGDQGKLLGSGNARLCLQVDDIEHALRDLHERGIPTTPAENKGTGILASLHDPDGNEICLWQYLSSPSPVVADL